MSSDKQFTMFTGDAQRLRDSTIAALVGTHIGRFNDALRIYQLLLRHLLETDREMHKAHDRVVGGDSLAAPREYGREWRILLRDLYVIVDVLAETPSPRTWSDFCRFIGNVTKDAAAYPEGPAIRDYWLLATDLWSAAVALRTPHAVRMRDNVLFTLHNLAWVRRPTGLDADGAAEVIRRLAAAYVSLMKRSVDLGDEQATLECLEYFDNSFDANFSDWSSDKSNGQEQVFVAASLLAIYAWILFRVGARSQPDMPQVRARIAESLVQRPVWEAAKVLRRDALDEYLKSSWWEVEMKGGRGGGVMIMSSYEGLAAIAAGVRPPPPDRASPGDFDEAQALSSLLSEGPQGTLERLQDSLRPNGFDVSGVAQRLDALVEASERAEQEALVKASIDESRVASFRLSVLEEIRSSRPGSVVALFQENADATEGVLGWRGRVPKEFFAPSPVLADEESLGRSLANSLIRGEEEQALRALREAASASNLPETTLEVLSSFAGTLDPSRWVMVTNSWQATDAVNPDWWQTEGRDEHPIDTPRLRIVQIWTEGESFAAFVDPGQSIEVLRGSIAPEGTDDVVDPELGVLVGVSELADSGAARGAHEGQALRGKEVENQAKVMVSVLEQFGVRIQPEPRVHWFRLPPD